MPSPTGLTYPPTLDDGPERDRLVQTIKDWTIANGLAVRPPPTLAGDDSEGILAMSAPVTLFPSPFPKTCFEEAKAIQTKYNELYARISQDEEYLSGLVQEWVSISVRVFGRFLLTTTESPAAMSSLTTCGRFTSG